MLLSKIIKYVCCVLSILVCLLAANSSNAQPSNEKAKKKSFFAKLKGKPVLNVTKDPFSKKQKKIKPPKQNDSFKSSSASEKNYGRKANGKRVKKVRNHNSNGSSNDAFVSKAKTKNYGNKSNGKRTRRIKNKDKKGDISSGSFTASNNYTTNYGKKTYGKRVKKKSNRNLKKLSKGSDAFASSVRLNKNAPSALLKGERSGKKFKKKKGLFHLVPKEERAYKKQSRAENARFSTTKKQEKFMKRQKRKKEDGLGLPHK